MPWTCPPAVIFHYTFNLFACSRVFTLCCQIPQQWSCGSVSGATADEARFLVWRTIGFFTVLTGFVVIT